MKLSQIIKKLDKFAPLDTQEKWDNCGIQLDYGDIEVKKIMLALTPTIDILQQSKINHCDLIVAHHPLFFVPFEFNQNVPIISFHTCLDKAIGGTTDCLIKKLGLNGEIKQVGEFLRIVQQEIATKDLISLIKSKLKITNLRVINNKNIQKIKNIALCSGSGSDFIETAKKECADVLITGDIKYHTAIDSDIMLIDAGHFETEIPVLMTLKNLMSSFELECILANEKSPFINY